MSPQPHQPLLRVIPAKVRVPTARLDAISRPRLLELLDDPRYRVVLVSAPAGSGKTALLLDWLRRSNRTPAWLSIDPLDNDPQRFLAHLAAALRSITAPTLQLAADILDGSSRSGSAPGPDLIAALDAAEPGQVLVLDDVHHLEAPQLVDLLDRLASGLSSGLRLVFLSRMDPAIRLGRIRLSGELLELRQRDLRFTFNEASDLLRGLLPFELEPKLVARLEERTEGWAAGLRMAAAALERVQDPATAVEAFTGSHHLMMDYLLEEAVGRQDSATQRFLMETSILPRFTAETCEVVTRDPAARRYLHAVDDANLFLVSLDGRGTWFRYHHLFGELLEFRLRRLFPERVENLRLRASEWFEGQGDLQEALRQAALMEEPSRLLFLLDRHGYAILARSEFGSFGHWLRHVPEPLAQPFPMFLVAVAWFRAQTERAPDLDSLLGSIETATRNPRHDYQRERIDEARHHLDALRAFSFRTRDRLQEAVEAGEAALRRIPPHARVRGVVEFNTGAVYLRLGEMQKARECLEGAFESNLRTGIPYLVLASLGHLGAIAAQTQGLVAARQRLESAVAFATERDMAGLPAFGIILYQLAQVHYLADELDQARELLERAAELTADERESDIHANVLIILTRVEAAAGRFDRAQELLTAAEALAHGHNVKPFATTLEVEGARLAEARGGLARSGEFFPAPRDIPDPWSTPREAETMLRLQHSLKLGLREEAASLALHLRQESEPRGRGVALCVARIAEAVVTSDARERREALEAGLELATRAGYVRPLLDGGRPVGALLEAGLDSASLSPGARAFARDLLARFPETDAPSASSPSGILSDLLTDREMETLALLATGRSNEAMARELYVSVNTVKTHLKRIFAKLGVSSRTEAVERGRALGLNPFSRD